MKRWRVWIGVAISVVAIIWAARGVDWRAFGDSLSGADWPLLMAVLVLTPAVNIVFRALRWRILLSPVAGPSLRSLHSATAIGPKRLASPWDSTS